MPEKTITIDDGDLRVWRAAERMGDGDPSAVVTAALRRYLDEQPVPAAGFEEVTVEVGVAPAREVHFVGALIGEWGRAREGDVEAIRVYRTPEGTFQVHTRREDRARVHGAGHNDSLWGWRSYLDMSLGRGEQSWSVVKGRSSLAQADDVDGLRSLLSDDVFDAVRDALGLETGEAPS
ncbi:EXLDI protein [Actinoplanes sp. NPDC049599]|uniref:EXLDI protein n=1 Tax=Actinoplanes sp. NPDC049599 TaxID=3363903 RepID=UPI00378854B5